MKDDFHNYLPSVMFRGTSCMSDQVSEFNIFQIIDQKKGTVAIFVWRVTWNYAYNPFLQLKYEYGFGDIRKGTINS